MPLAMRLRDVRTEFEPNGVGTFAYLDDVALTHLELDGEVVQAVGLFRGQVHDVGAVTNEAMTVALPPGHVLTEASAALLAEVGGVIATMGGAVVVATSIGTNTLVKEHATQAFKQTEVNGIARLNVRISDTQQR